MLPSKDNQPMPFETSRDMLNKLVIDYGVFFEEYHFLFEENVKSRFYNNAYITSLLPVLRQFDITLLKYLRTYMSNTSFPTIWSMVLYFSQNHALEGTLENALTMNLQLQIRKISITITEFKNLFKDTKESAQLIKGRNRMRLSRILQRISHVYLYKYLYLEHQSHLLFEWDAKEFLSVLTQLSWALDYKDESCLFVLKHLLFRVNDFTNNKHEKLKHLFQRISNLNEGLCATARPEKIIKDDWLIDYTYDTLCDWLQLTQRDYQSLCESHQNNKWLLYIWSKLVSLSMSNLIANDCEYFILEQLNKWMVTIQHEKYQDTDPLTVTFVYSVFESLIYKQIKSLILLPNIQTIISYIMDAGNANSRWITSKNMVEEFVETVKQLIRNVLLLEGANTTYRQLSKPSIIYCFIQYVDFKTILSRAEPLNYKFPLTAPHINMIMDKHNPSDIDVSTIESEEDFVRFIKQTNVWLD
ncbi:unnamed protein product, partial [Adineta ricciae]